MFLDPFRISGNKCAHCKLIDDELSIELNDPLQVKATRGMHGAWIHSRNDA
jgi:hypothetical protein